MSRDQGCCASERSEMLLDWNGTSIDIPDDAGRGRSGLLFTMALLVAVLEDKGVLKRSEFVEALRSVLSNIDDQEKSPEAVVCEKFVELLEDDAPVRLRS